MQLMAPKDFTAFAGSCALALALALSASGAAAQERDFPNRALKLVVPFPAGGPSDVLARLIGAKLTERWGQPVVIENRPGANTVIGAQVVARAPPDGYTLLMAIDSTLVMNQFMYRTPPYDPFNDFAPVTLVAKTMQLLMVNAASEVTSVKALIAKARSDPGKLNYGAGRSPPSSPASCSIAPRACARRSFPTTAAPTSPRRS
jgi:tripartite-type tricarboxylate transporter receptor subunit TctC